MLKCQNLSVQRGHRAILQDFTGDFPESGLVMILGPNGSGKSTLLKALAGLLPEVKSQVFWHNQTLNKVSRQDLARSIGWAPPQIEAAFPYAVDELVMMGRFPRHQGYPRTEDFEAVTATLQQLDISHLQNRTLSTLSSGERAKVNLARVLVNDPKVILLDEPCANLDIGYTLKVLGFLKDLAHNEGKLVIMAHHDLTTVIPHASHLIVLNNGQTVGFDSTQNLFTNEMVCQVFGVSYSQFANAVLTLVDTPSL